MMSKVKHFPDQKCLKETKKKFCFTFNGPLWVGVGWGGMGGVVQRAERVFKGLQN